MRLNFYFPVIQAISPHISFAFKFMTTISSGHAHCFVWELGNMGIFKKNKLKRLKMHQFQDFSSNLVGFLSSNCLIFNRHHNFQGCTSLICKRRTKGWDAWKHKTKTNFIVVAQNASFRCCEL